MYVWTDITDVACTPGFLVETSHVLKGWVRYDLLPYPPTTNMGHRAKPRGWCGTTNDVAVYGKGLGKVVKITANGLRAKVAYMTDAKEIEEALEGLGYPNLLKEVLP